ncbi:MAG: hypothetical protein JXB18_15020 [Sedimentisphaerales bacterium]|nr:hypothetical protein [Sedimentisphaerales bacterium]
MNINTIAAVFIVVRYKSVFRMKNSVFMPLLAMMMKSRLDRNMPIRAMAQSQPKGRKNQAHG